MSIRTRVKCLDNSSSSVAVVETLKLELLVAAGRLGSHLYIHVQILRGCGTVEP